MELPTPFEPSPGGVRVSLVKGVDRWSTVPNFVTRAGLAQRLAVVQQTYVEGCSEMYFEEPLWRALADFIQSMAGEGVVEVTTEDRKRLPLGRFLQDWASTAADEREPPPVLTVIAGTRPVLCMITDYWTRVGGPAPYNDSYTYSVYSARDLEADVSATLMTNAASQRWTIAPEVTLVK